MAVRGSAMTRALDYFEKADLREARFVLLEASDTLKRRGGETKGPMAVKTRRPRKVRTNGTVDNDVSKEKAATA